MLQQIQIDTTHFRSRPRRNPGFQSQRRSVNRTAVFANVGLVHLGFGLCAIRKHEKDKNGVDDMPLAERQAGARLASVRI